MRRLLLSVSAAALVMLAAVAAMPTDTTEAQGPPPHGHMLVLHLEIEVIEGAPHVVGFRCVDLAGGRHIPLNAHHARVHTGTAGVALENAGHAVVPTAPLTDWANCADLEAELAEGPIPLGPPPE